MGHSRDQARLVDLNSNNPTPEYDEMQNTCPKS